MNEVFVIFEEVRDYAESGSSYEIRHIVSTEQEAKDFVEKEIAATYEYFHNGAVETVRQLDAQKIVYEKLSPEDQKVMFPNGIWDNKWQRENAKKTLEQFAKNGYDGTWHYERFKVGL